METVECRYLELREMWQVMEVHRSELLDAYISAFLTAVKIFKFLWYLISHQVLNHSLNFISPKPCKLKAKE